MRNAPSAAGDPGMTLRCPDVSMAGYRRGPGPLNHPGSVTSPRRSDMKSILLAAVLALGLVPVHGAAAQPGNPADLIAAERDGLAPLAWMDGVWRGPAWTILPTGEKHEVTQTERIGPFLDGSIKMIEGRGYNADGTVGFNAFGVVFFDPAKNTYQFHSHAMGRSGDFELKPAAGGTGYSWDIPAGPMTIRYTATLKDGVWREVGHRIVPGSEPVQFFEMNLT